MIFENQKADFFHKPVLLQQVMEYLKPQRGGIFVDATLGLGGHAEALLLSSSSLNLIGLDQDSEAIRITSERLRAFSERFRVVHSNFVRLKKVLSSLGIDLVDGILADLGVSSLQLESKERGFSFRFDAPLDMRMNSMASLPTAAELLEKLSEKEIADLIFRYGEERYARRIARRIVEKRQKGEPVKTTIDLVRIVNEVIGRRVSKIHPATRVFQALRIAVNNELENLERFVFDAVDVLKKEGRLVLISFHSLEDRIIKRSLAELSGKKIEVLTRKPIRPSESEVRENPRSRSAKLRACVRL